jgi:predicted outer membrane repeat protein
MMMNRCTESTPTSRKPTTHKLVGALAALSTAVAAHAQTVLYVDDDAPGGGNGQSWGEAFEDLQDALWRASFVNRGTVEIRIAQGIYTPDRGTGVREALFMIDSTLVGSVSSGMVGGFHLSLRGAFAGIKALDPNERDANRFKSVLSGDLNGDDLPGFVNYDENSHRIMQVQGVGDPGVELDGLVFRGGNGGHGGALLLAGSRVDVLDCIFVENQAYQGGAVAFYGGDPIIERCFFGQNKGGSHGGAIAAWSDGRIVNSVFAGNSARAFGGAIYNGQNLRVSGCTFYGNQARYSGGGAFYSWNGSPTVSNSVFFGNTPTPIAHDSRSNITVSYSNVRSGYAGVGNIDTDPLFTDPLGKDGILGTPDDNFLPRFGSPVIDAASNSLFLSWRRLDYAGQPRIIDDRFTPDTGLGTAPIVDMGAYEFQPPSCYADLDQSTGVGVLDLFDFLRFQTLFVVNDPLACQVDRSTGNGVCDIFDFLAFQSEFSAGCP